MSSKDVKRKVQDTSFENREDEEKGVFQRSQLVARSPPIKRKIAGGSDTINDEMAQAQIVKGIQEMRQELKDGFEKSNKQNEELAKQLEATNEELRQIKKEMKRKEEEWYNEKQEIMARVQSLEKIIEKQEKGRRKNNIIMKNAGITGNDVAKGVESFAKQKLGVSIEVAEAYEISKGVILAKIDSWEQKKKVMQNKSKLQGSKTYIENDLTRQERDIQRQLRMIAKEEKEKGNEAKVKYQKIKINNKMYSWDEMKKNRLKN